MTAKKPNNEADLKRRAQKRKPFDKYAHYQVAVQSPEDHVHIFDRMFNELRGRQAISLREDFCGTYMISCEWVKSHPKRTAIGIDLDSEPIEYGNKVNFKLLKPDQKKRVKILQQNVMSPVKQKVDIIGAGNFSFFVFKKREELVKYFKAALRGLNKDGIFSIELAGGAGFIYTGREQKTYKVPGVGRFTYYWDQKSFDPIQHHGIYAIHFKSSDGVFHKDCFTYDWRVWTIPELREAMIDAGFKDTYVYWETADKNGNGTGEFLRADQGENDYSWIAFVVGTR